MADPLSDMCCSLEAAVGSRVTWKSPLATDGRAEYRDGDFLRLLDADDLVAPLAEFWPARGPQWDALGVTEKDLLLVEAKAHIPEMFSACAAGEVSLRQIERALAETALALGTSMTEAWTRRYYQYANRLAHLHFLRKNNRRALLVLVSFVGDSDMHGPTSVEEWRVAYSEMDRALNLSAEHPLSRYVIHLYPSTDALKAPS